jgi:predicted nucleotidyltransferase
MKTDQLSMSTKPLITTEAQALIETRLASIADEHQIKVLYACESGSRAWGFPSPDSDYDVRFIYVHPWSWYMSLEEERDVIDFPLEETYAGLLDLGGWDLRKTLRLLRKSNPVIWKWLQSPICYHLSQPHFQEYRPILDPYYSPIAACHHYLSICSHTMDQAFVGPSVKIKKYFYMLRPLLAAAWIERYHSVPPMELAHLLPLLDDQVEIQNCIVDLQERKRHIDEQVPIARIAMLDDFLGRELMRLQEAAKLLPAGTANKASLDRLFQQCLGL